MKCNRFLVLGLLAFGCAPTPRANHRAGDTGGAGGMAAGGDIGSRAGGAGSGGVEQSGGTGGMTSGGSSGGRVAGGAGGDSGGVAGMASAGGNAGQSAGGASAGGNAGQPAGGASAGGVAGTSMGGNAGSPPIIQHGGVFVAVGGERTMRSFDLGQTWVDETIIAEASLNSVGFAMNQFIAGDQNRGLYRSLDGRTWGDKIALNNWPGQLATDNSIVLVVGGVGRTWLSSDGIEWIEGARLDSAIRTVVFADGVFTAATDTGTWFTSSDGMTWDDGETGHTSNLVYCGDHVSDRDACTGPAAHGRHPAFGEGVWITTAGGYLERSVDDGQSWERVEAAGSGWMAVGFGVLE